MRDQEGNIAAKPREKFFNRQMILFLLIGGGNTVLSLGLMYGMYNLLSFGYWASSAAAFFLCSIISFFLNKKYTFQNNDSLFKAGIKFALVIAVCYAVAYELARPLVLALLNMVRVPAATTTVERIALLVGQVIFTCLNYLGQRYFAFAKKKSDTDPAMGERHSGK